MTNSVKMNMEMSPALNEMLNELVESSGASLEEIVLKGVALYGIATRAKQENQHLGILDDKQQLVAEIDGY
jgi:hypothetical protein